MWRFLTKNRTTSIGLAESEELNGKACYRSSLTVCLCSQQILLHYGLVNGLAIKSNVVFNVFNVFNNVMCKLIAFNQENKIFFYKKFFYVYNFFYKFFSLSGLSLFVRELFAMYILYYVSHFSYKRNISCFQPLVVDVNMYCL